MFDVPDNEEPGRPSLIRRMFANPIRLRRQTLVALGCATALAGASRLIDAWPGGFLTALLWVIVLPLALGIAAGDAFLVAHGRARRRLLLTIVGAVFVALSSCVVLAMLSEGDSSTGRDAAGAAAYAVFYAANVLGLSAAIALAIGRGGDYVSRRIDVMSEEDW
jgi:hypothetical protein